MEIHDWRHNGTALLERDRILRRHASVITVGTDLPWVQPEADALNITSEFLRRVTWPYMSDITDMAQRAGAECLRHPWHGEECLDMLKNPFNDCVYWQIDLKGPKKDRQLCEALLCIVLKTYTMQDSMRDVYLFIESPYIPTMGATLKYLEAARAAGMPFVYLSNSRERKVKKWYQIFGS